MGMGEGPVVIPAGTDNPFPPAIHQRTMASQLLLVHAITVACCPKFCSAGLIPVPDWSIVQWTERMCCMFSWHANASSSAQEAAINGQLFSGRPPWEHGVQLRLPGRLSYLLWLHMPL